VADIVVTVPKGLWLDWIYEGDAVGQPPSGEEWGFFLGGPRPHIEPGEYVYVVAHGRLRGYSPLTRVMPTDRGFALCRKAEAQAVTIDEKIPGFRGWRARWWDRSLEQPFPEWMFADVTATNRQDRESLRLIEKRFRSGEPMRPTPHHGALGDLFTQITEHTK
jgi:hypothetical protein